MKYGGGGGSSPAADRTGIAASKTSSTAHMSLVVLIRSSRLSFKRPALHFSIQYSPSPCPSLSPAFGSKITVFLTVRLIPLNLPVPPTIVRTPWYVLFVAPSALWTACDVPS